MGTPARTSAGRVVVRPSAPPRMSVAARAAPQNCVLEELQGAEEGQHDPNPGMLQEQPDNEGDETPEEVDDDLQVLNARPEGLPRQRREASVPLDTSLLHRGTRLEKPNKGFNLNAASHNTSATSSATPSTKAKETKKKSKSLMLNDGPSYVGHSVPGASPTPHLSLTNAHAIGTGFYKMQTSAVSGDVLLAGDNENNNN